LPCRESALDREQRPQDEADRHDEQAAGQHRRTGDDLGPTAFDLDDRETRSDREDADQRQQPTDRDHKIGH
jgi:hypothetical protein